MQITNKLGLPEPLVRAVKNDQYTKGDADFSVTQLIKPPLIDHLEQEHADELESDVSDSIWQLMGQSIHTILERASEGVHGELPETRLYGRVISENGEYMLSGQADRLHLASGTLQDYKITSAWAVLHGTKPEWVAQLNMYRWLLNVNGIAAKNLEIVAILRDWNRSNMMRSEDYPRHRVVVIPIPVWPLVETEQFIRNRIEQHTATPPRPCTPEERWHQPGKAALMKHGRKSAVRLYDSMDALTKACMETGLIKEDAGGIFFTDSKHYIDNRPGKDNRCEDYCPVNRWCDYYQSQKEDNDES